MELVLNGRSMLLKMMQKTQFAVVVMIRQMGKFGMKTSYWKRLSEELHGALQ